MKIFIESSYYENNCKLISLNLFIYIVDALRNKNLPFIVHCKKQFKLLNFLMN